VESLVHNGILATFLNKCNVDLFCMKYPLAELWKFDGSQKLCFEQNTMTIIMVKYVFEEVDTQGGNYDEMKPVKNKHENQRGNAWFHFIMVKYIN